MITITIKTDNAAFHGDDEGNPCAYINEVARILYELADQYENGGNPSLRLRDINGNTVGEVALTGRDKL